QHPHRYRLRAERAEALAAERGPSRWWIRPTRKARGVRSRADPEEAEAAHEAVVVAAAALLALVLGEALPRAMRVPRGPRVADGHAAQPLRAERERRRDVEVPIEAVALVESADGEERLAARREAVALHRVTRAAGDLVPLLEVIDRAQAPRPGGSDRARAERRRERSEEIVGELDGRIELKEEPPAGDAEEGVAARALAQVAVGEHDPHARIRREREHAARDLGGRAEVEHKHLRIGREPAEDRADRALQVSRELTRQHADRPRAGRVRRTLVGQLASRRDPSQAARLEATVGARDEQRAAREVVDAPAIETRPQLVGHAQVA